MHVHNQAGTEHDMRFACTRAMYKTAYAEDFECPRKNWKFTQSFKAFRMWIALKTSARRNT